MAHPGTAVGRFLLFLVVGAVCGVMVAGLMMPAAAVAGSAAGFSAGLVANLPDELKIDTPSQSTDVLANDGSVIATFYSQNRDSVALEQMSPYIRDGIVSIEDARFYEHGGIDPTGILRALAATAGGGRQGASTITQQYVNNVIIQSHIAAGRPDLIHLGAAKTVGDKIREMKLAVSLEKTYSKEQILQGYLNIIYFNHNV